MHIFHCATQHNEIRQDAEVRKLHAHGEIARTLIKKKPARTLEGKERKVIGGGFIEIHYM